MEASTKEKKDEQVDNFQIQSQNTRGHFPKPKKKKIAKLKKTNFGYRYPNLKKFGYW